MKKKEPTSEDEAKDEDGDGGSGGSGGSIVRSFDEITVTNFDEAEIAALSDQALLEIRRQLKSKGHIVRALDKPQEDRNRLQNDNNAPGQEAGGGLGLEDHPELPEMGGMVDPNIIVLPKSEQDALAVKDMDLKLQLLNEYKKKNEMKMGMKLTEKPSPAPTIRPRNNPSHPRPRPF